MDKPLLDPLGGHPFLFRSEWITLDPFEHLQAIFGFGCIARVPRGDQCPSQIFSGKAVFLRICIPSSLVQKISDQTVAAIVVTELVGTDEGDLVELLDPVLESQLPQFVCEMGKGMDPVAVVSTSFFAGFRETTERDIHQLLVRLRSAQDGINHILCELMVCLIILPEVVFGLVVLLGHRRPDDVQSLRDFSGGDVLFQMLYFSFSVVVHFSVSFSCCG